MTDLSFCKSNDFSDCNTNSMTVARGGVINVVVKVLDP